jgi:hypothetical protein
LHTKQKSHPGQTDEDRWREIYARLFPFAESVPGPCELPLRRPDASNKNLTFSIVDDHDTATDIGPPSVSDGISLGEIGDMAVLERFQQQATTWVNNAIKPLETRLLDQLTSLIRGSQDTISSKSQEPQETHFQRHTDLDSSMNSFSTSAKSRDNLSATPTNQNTTDSNMGGLNDFPLDQSSQFDLDSFINTWDSSLSATNPMITGPSSFDSPFGRNLSCSCVGTCTCRMTDHQASTPFRTDQIGEGVSLTKDPDVMNLLRNMSRSIQALEKRLQVNHES